MSQSFLEKPKANLCDGSTHSRKITRMARKRLAETTNQTTTTAANETKRCMKPGPIQRNPYLNFLREYRQKFCGLSPVETIRQGARAWKALSKEEKVRFIVEAYYARRRGRRRRRRKSLVRYRLARKIKSRNSRIEKRGVRSARNAKVAK